MSTFKHPVGPQPSSVYWRRRLIVLIGLVVLYGLSRTLDRDARKRERDADSLASKLTKTQQTPESERVASIKKLLEAKTACEHELERRAACAGDDAGTGGD